MFSLFYGGAATLCFGLLQMLCCCLLIECFCISPFDGQSSGGTLANAGSQAIAKRFSYHPSFAIYHFYRSL
jgi:hypothetical protein